jgi:hypothetical protein
MRILQITLALVSFFLLAGCKKDQVRSTRTNLLVINASPNSGAIELKQNLNSIGSFNYLRGLSLRGAYLQLDSGFNNYQLLAGSNTIANWVYANTGFHQSLFIADTATAARVKFFFLKDNLDTTGLGVQKRCKIRVIHLVPDLDSLDFLTNSLINPAADSVILVKKSYLGVANESAIADASNFFTFFADSAVNFRIRRSINNSVARSYRFNFERGGVYSLVLKGYHARSGGDSLSLSIVQH